MWVQVHILLLFLAICATAFDDLLYVNGDLPRDTDMLEQGKQQYQVLKERGQLPKYGQCWKQAFEHVEEGCRALTEDTQSNIALHMTNCFLAMSGHETYNCASDKKANLRAICISSMTDRAFNVYTEFYPHTQNICWYLRGQMWQEMIAENTQKVGKQLDESAKNQALLLKTQQESIAVQDKIMKYGIDLEKLLGSFVATTQQHHDVIRVLTATVANLQSWLIGEISWVDSVLFYLVSSFIIMFLTSTPRTIAARLPLLLIFTCNIMFERLLCHKMSYADSMDARIVHGNYYEYVWYMRYIFVGISLLILSATFYNYKDYLIENNLMLENLKQEVQSLSKTLKTNIDVPSTRLYPQEEQRFYSESERNSSRNSVSDLGGQSSQLEENPNVFRPQRRRTPLIDVHGRYNLRSRQGTPVSSII